MLNGLFIRENIYSIQNPQETQCLIYFAGETLLSPLVMCGPHGTQFLKPVELRLPHCASMTPDGWSFALKSSDTPTGNATGNNALVN